MSLAKDIANTLFDCATYEEVVMRVAFRCGVDVRKTPMPRGLALSILGVMEDKISQMLAWNSTLDPKGLCNLKSSLDGVMQKTMMFEKLSRDDRVEVVYGVACKLYYRADEQPAWVELVALLVRGFKIENNDILNFVRTQPKSHAAKYFLCGGWPSTSTPILDAF